MKKLKNKKYKKKMKNIFKKWKIFKKMKNEKIF